MVCFSPSIQQQKQDHSCKANDVGMMLIHGKWIADKDNDYIKVSVVIIITSIHCNKHELTE